MGRRILTAAAVATTALGVVAVPAFANSAGHTYSNGTKLTHKQKSLVATRMHAIQTTALTTGQAHVINHGTFSECTVPEGNHTYANFYSTDTVHYLETDTATANRGLLIGTCTADLTKKQTSASSTDKPGGKMIIPTPGRFASYSEACNIVYQGTNFIGDAESIVYKSGEFDETCVVPVTIS